VAGSVPEQDLKHIVGRLLKVEPVLRYREQLLAALTQLVAERGYHEATVAQVARRAKVSRRGFYELFEDKERCFLAAQDPLARRLEEVDQAVSKAGEGQGAEAAIGAVVGFAEREPAVFTLLAHEARSATALLG
jgi:AcrR family transcriptional regulator